MFPEVARRNGCHARAWDTLGIVFLVDFSSRILLAASLPQILSAHKGTGHECFDELRRMPTLYEPTILSRALSDCGHGSVVMVAEIDVVSFRL